MKGAIVAAAALAGGATARKHAHAHAHAELFARGAKSNDTGVCVPGCTTIWKTTYGEATWVPAPPPPPPTSTLTPAVPVPTPEVTICPTPGTYTIPAKTVIVKETQVVCAYETKVLTPGPCTYGGITTVVDKPTVVTCPYPAQETHKGVVTEVVKSTVITCPSAGTYTVVPPTSTAPTKDVTVTVKKVETYCPGTYTAPPATVTVTATNSVYVCPTLALFTPPPPPPPPAVEKPKEEPKKEAPKVEEPKKEAPKVEEPKKETPKVVGGGSGRAITYTAYFPDGGCKPQSEVTKDLKMIKAYGVFTHVKIYSTDCNMMETVPAACAEVGLGLDIGVFTKTAGCSMSNPDISGQVSAIEKFLKSDKGHLVRYCVVGNEAIFKGHCQPQELGSLIVKVKEIIKSCGSSAIVTTVETTNILERKDVRDALVGTCDVIGANLHSFFNAAVTSSGAGKFVNDQISYIKELCGVDKVYVGEAGWPSLGASNGNALASPEDQKKAVKSILANCPPEVTLMAFGRKGEYDDWKNDEREKSWTIDPDCFN